MARIGYARVSTDEQSNLSQADELRAAGCDQVHEEQASGGSRSRPVLNQVLTSIRRGDTLVVVRIDRLARSLSHLLEVIEDLERRGAHFRSLRDPIDTSSPQGKFTLQVLGAAAEFERALIRERTIAGLETARSQGRTGGNPGLISGDKETLRKIQRARSETYFEKLEASAAEWVPVVRRMRPHSAWEDVLRVINIDLPAEQEWTMRRLLRAVHAYVRDGLLPKETLHRTQRKVEDRLPAIIAAMKGGNQDLTLSEIGARLEKMRERTPRGAARWSPSSVKLQMDRAISLGLLHGEQMS